MLDHDVSLRVGVAADAKGYCPADRLDAEKPTAAERRRSTRMHRLVMGLPKGGAVVIVHSPSVIGIFRDLIRDLRGEEIAALNGIAECRSYLAKAKDAVRVIPAQAKLKALRYPVGAVDGVPGDRTTGAVQLLQKKAGLPVTGELDDDTLAALDGADPLPIAAKDANLAKSRTVQGAGMAGTFGLAEVAQSATELKDQVESAQAQISAGTVFGFAMGALIVAGAVYALYARWDDAGRPVPGFLAHRFPRLAGAA